jgi:hypothetical protein
LSRVIPLTSELARNFKKHSHHFSSCPISEPPRSPSVSAKSQLSTYAYLQLKSW